jgi:hypothetical protein
MVLTNIECALADTLYTMLQDRDPLVVANCVAGLEEASFLKACCHADAQILAREGGILLTRETAYILFNRLREFPDWSQCAVMSVLARYVPSNEDEIFDILVRQSHPYGTHHL